MPLVSKSFSDIITFSRGSNATYFDSAGVLKYAPNNAIRNNTGVGAVAGTPGTLPTNWTAQNVGGVALTEVVGTGTEDGIAYVDVRYTGTTSSTASGGVLAEQGLQIAALPGQTWVSSVFVRLIAGNLTNITSVANSIFERDSGGVLVAQTNATFTPTGAALSTQRFFATRTLSNASTVFVQSRITITPVSGAAIDITLRIGLPQLEIGDTAGPAIPTSGTAYYGPRFDYNPSTLAAQGLLIEEQRTNSIRNNTMQGAVAGTPGTAPTNWAIAAAANGIDRDIVGTGTENGITYIDVRFYGTATAAYTSFNLFESGTFVVAFSGQTWTDSAYFKLQAGATTNVTNLQLVIDEIDSGGSLLARTATTISPTSAALSTQRVVATRPFNNATTAFARTGFRFEVANGAAIDITLRIGLPQLELGAFATSVIPTTTTALTRAADVASVNTLSPWFNASEGTLFMDAQRPYFGSTAGLAQVDDGTNSNRMAIQTSSTAKLRCFIVFGGTIQTQLDSSASIADNVTFKSALAYATDNASGALNGTDLSIDPTVTVPTGLTTLRIGSGLTSLIGGHIQRITYYPRRLSNAELQAITS
jgi:hypothetical protein